MTMNGGLGIAHLADIEPIGDDTGRGIYTATDLKLDRRVSVRVFDPLATAGDRGRFSHESKVLGSLSSHPNVVTIYDAGLTDDDRPFLVMELLDGERLATRLASAGPMPWAQAAHLVLQVCTGLEQAHRSGALHRDLRPENILLAGSVPKLTEFGISGSGVPPSVDPAAMQHRAPESFRSIWDERTDLYSLTSTLYELIDGRAPFWRPGQDSAQALELRLTHEQPPGLDPDLVPAALNQFIAAGLSKDPLDRPQDASEFGHELRLIVEGRTTGSTPSVLHGTSAPTSTLAMATPPPTPGVAAAPVAGAAVGSPTVMSPVPAVPIAAAPLIGEVPGMAPATASTVVTSGPPAAMATPSALAVPSAPAVPASPEAPGQAGWQTPAQQAPAQPQWAPPAATSDGTAIYSDFAGQVPGTAAPQYDPYAAPQSAAPMAPSGGNIHLEDEEVRPRRSAAFMAALAMIVVGVLGLGAVLALGALDSDDQQAAPALPDPDETVAVEAGGEDGQTDGATPAPAEGNAMESSETTIEAMEEQSSTTETTVQRFQVPDLVGMSVEDASKLLTDANFEVLVVGRRAVNANPGTVTGQAPAAGAQVTLPLTVTLFIPTVSNLPEMVGRSADAVCLELQALGLVCERQPMYNDQIPVGSVTATNPVGGAVFSEGTTITVSVSLGPVLTVAVPDVANMTEMEAEAALTGAGFIQIVKAARESATVELGRVIGTEPAAGSLLQVDRPLTMMVSAGAPSMARVPELVGMSAEDAQNMLTAAGLTVTMATMDLPEGDPKIGTVVSTDPVAGTQVAPGSAVTITVGQQAAAPENPENNDGENANSGESDA